MKVICDSPLCAWRGMEKEVLKAPSPFNPEEDLLDGCPKCLQIGTIREACDERDCWMEVTRGTPTKDGYRFTCWLHMPKTEEEG